MKIKYLLNGKIFVKGTIRKNLKDNFITFEKEFNSRKELKEFLMKI